MQACFDLFCSQLEVQYNHLVTTESAFYVYKLGYNQTDEYHLPKPNCHAYTLSNPDPIINLNRTYKTAIKDRFT